MPLADMPQANKQHAVPQNIMDVEFKLIGDLTIRQFAYLMFCGGVAYSATVMDLGIFKWPIVIFFVLLGVGLAFVPIQERGLDEWMVNFFRAIYTPTLRIWRKEPQIPSAFVRENLAVMKQELITLAPTSSRRKLEEYLEYQSKEVKVDPLDIPEREYAKKVREAFASDTTYSVASATGYDTPSLGGGVSVAVEEPLEVPMESSIMPSGEEIPTPQQGNLPDEKENVTQIPSTVEQPTPVASVVSTETLQTTATTSAPVAVTAPTPVPTQSSQGDTTPAAIVPQRHVESKIITSGGTRNSMHSTKSGSVMPRAHSYYAKQSSSLSPMTPDMHSGRRFTNLVPKSGELVLPIRGEHTLRTSDQLEIEDDINEKAEKLKQLLSQIKGNPNAVPAKEAVRQEIARPVKPEPREEIVEKPQITVQPQVTVQPSAENVVPATPPLYSTQHESATPIPPSESVGVDAQAQLLANRLKSENERITKQLADLQMSRGQNSNQGDIQKRDELILKLKTEQQRTQADFEALQKQLLDLQNKLKEKEKESGQIAVGSSVKPVYARIQPLTNKPNVPSGIVKLADGTVLEGTLLIIKNSKNEAVRAFKTNTLGQFVLTTALQNGVYTLEVSTNNKALSFDIISLEAKGDVIPPIEIIGKSA